MNNYNTWVCKKNTQHNAYPYENQPDPLMVACNGGKTSDQCPSQYSEYSPWGFEHIPCGEIRQQEVFLNYL